MSYHRDHAAGPDTVNHSCHAHIVRILSSSHEVLVSYVSWTVIDHEHTTLHSDGPTAVKHRVEVRAVAHALIVTTTKVFILIEDDLKMITGV